MGLFRGTRIRPVRKAGTTYKPRKLFCVLILLVTFGGVGFAVPAAFGHGDHHGDGNGRHGQGGGQGQQGGGGQGQGQGGGQGQGQGGGGWSGAQGGGGRHGEGHHGSQGGGGQGHGQGGGGYPGQGQGGGQGQGQGQQGGGPGQGQGGGQGQGQGQQGGGGQSQQGSGVPGAAHGASGGNGGDNGKGVGNGGFGNGSGNYNVGARGHLNTHVNTHGTVGLYGHTPATPPAVTASTPPPAPAPAPTPTPVSTPTVGPTSTPTSISTSTAVTRSRHGRSHGRRSARSRNTTTSRPAPTSGTTHALTSGALVLGPTSGLGLGTLGGSGTGTGSGATGLVGSLAPGTTAIGAQHATHRPPHISLKPIVPALTGFSSTVIDRFIKVIPTGVWIALAIALALAGAAGLAALRSNRRIRLHAGEVAAVTAEALTDPLTGVLNRRGFIEAAERELDRARRYGHPLALAFVDIRGLKSVNDTEGHLAGDQLLKSVTALLRESARTHDLVGRIGGDELAVLLAEQSADGAAAMTQRVRAQVPAYRARLGLVTAWDVTIGTSTFPEDGDGLEELLDSADRRLYQQRGIDLAR